MAGLEWVEQPPSNPYSPGLPPPEFRTFFPGIGERWETPIISEDVPIVDVDAALDLIVTKALVPEYDFTFTATDLRARGPLHHWQFPNRWYEGEDLVDESLSYEEGKLIGFSFRGLADRKSKLPPPIHGLAHDILIPRSRPNREFMRSYNLARYPLQKMVQIVTGSKAAAQKAKQRGTGEWNETLHAHLAMNMDAFGLVYERALAEPVELTRVDLSDLPLNTTHDMLKIRERLADIAVIKTPIPLVMVDEVNRIAA